MALRMLSSELHTCGGVARPAMARACRHAVAAQASASGSGSGSGSSRGLTCPSIGRRCQHSQVISDRGPPPSLACRAGAAHLRLEAAAGQEVSGCSGRLQPCGRAGDQEGVARPLSPPAAWSLLLTCVQQVFLEIDQGGQPLGRIVIGLYGESRAFLHTAPWSPAGSHAARDSRGGAQDGRELQVRACAGPLPAGASAAG